jgi:arylsulfatase A-like enzyme
VDGLQEFHGKDIYLTEALTRKALQLLEYPIAKKKPFFLHFAHYAVHTPLQPDPRYIGKYLANGLDSIEAAYASMVEGMDKSLGDVMDFLEERKIADNTVIVFLSDNGGLSAVGRGGRPNVHNRPLRSGKGSPYEGGIRIPMIVKWAGHAKEGSRTKTPVGMEDISPTLLAMANARSPVQKMDGNNLVPLLEGKPKGQDEKTILIHYPHRWTVPEEDGIAWTSAFISGKWKLVYRMKKKKLELYDLEADLSELHDLSDTSPSETKRMALMMGNALRNCNAQMPVWKQTGKQVSWPDELMKK